jgi:hypothetical protein
LGFLQYFKIFDVDFVGQVILLIAGNIKPLFIWRLSAIRRKTIVWMFLDRILVIHHRAFTANEDERLAVVEHPNLIRHEQFFATMSSDEFKKDKHYPKKNFFYGICLFCFR